MSGHRNAYECIAAFSATDFTEDVRSFDVPRADRLVEPFRRADLVDVSKAWIRFGLRRDFVAAVYSTWPAAGFHGRLVQLTLRRLRSNPLDPLPMVRW